MIYRRVPIQYAGVAVASDLTQPLIIDASGFELATVVVRATEGTWSTAAFEVKFGDEKFGPWASGSPAITLAAGSIVTTGLVPVQGRYLVVEITTGEGAADYVDIEVNLRRGSVSYTLP